MASINKKSKLPIEYTHEGATVRGITDVQRLRRSVLANLLWENNFYEDGVDNAARIVDLASKVKPKVVSDLAIEARTVHGLRHVPLLLLLDLIKRGGTGVASTIATTITRPDEITELAALYWKFNPNKDFSAQLKKGFASAFNKFDEYQLAKYNRDGDVKLRDVLFLSHAKPKDAFQATLFDKLINGELATPDTWETNLSGGADKKETFERLISEGKLGYMALLRNLCNMEIAGVDRKLVREAIRERKGSKYVLPFRYLAAAKAAPTYTGDLEEALLGSLEQAPKLKGKTVLIVDVSGSMQSSLSDRSDMSREDAASSLAIILREVSEDIDIYANGNRTVKIKNLRGVALRDAIKNSGAGYDGITLTPATKFAKVHTSGPIERVVVITDGQDTGYGDNAPHKALLLGKRNYIINVAAYKNGVGYGPWNQIDGFSESIIKYLVGYEEEFS